MHTYSKNPLRPHAQAASSFFAAAHAVISNAAHWFAGSWLAKIFAVVAAERRARNAALELRRWDDYMLRDVGLERMNIDAAVRGQHLSAQWQPDCDPVKVHRLQNFH